MHIGVVFVLKDEMREQVQPLFCGLITDTIGTELSFSAIVINQSCCQVFGFNIAADR